MNVQFDNENRNRYYGLRVGDIVEERAFSSVLKGEVIEYCMDNNRVYIRTEQGNHVSVVCEYCTIIEKVEDKITK